MADITIGYKGATIAEISATGTTTLGTRGKYCEDDITLQYAKPSAQYIGGTVAWNQLVQTNSASVNVPSGHKYLSRINGTNTIAISNGSAIPIIDGTRDNVFDLTAMFGSAIADYVYTLESNTAGSGIAWLNANGFFNLSYYPYDAGTLKSIESYSAYAMSNNSPIIGNFGMNFNLELRGIPKLDANNVLYYDGDEYTADGTVTRKYGIVDLGTLSWNASTRETTYKIFSTIGIASVIKDPANNWTIPAGFKCARYVTSTFNIAYAGETDKAISVAKTNHIVLLVDSAFANYSAEQVATALSGVYLVYELATPTTESV